MNVTAHRTIGMAWAGDPETPPQPVKPDDPEPNLPGPKPPPDDLSARALTALVSQLTTGYAAAGIPKDAPGPVDPYIRKALERSVAGSSVASNLWRFIAEKHPEIWEIIGGGPLTAPALNPQPLPPRSAFLAALILEYTERMTLVCEMADLLPRPGSDPGYSVVASHVAKFVDEVCGNGFKLRWPFPWPAPVWFNTNLSAGDLVVMGSQFQQCAGLALDPDLDRIFADAAHALLEAGAARFV